MDEPKRVTSAEWVANAAALMGAHDYVEIVDDAGLIKAVYSRPHAPAFDCDACEVKDDEIATLRSQLRDIDAQASSIVAAHHRWFDAPTSCGAVCSDEMAAIDTAAIAIRAACRAGEGK